MASRPIFFPSTKHDLLVETREINFKWNPGLAASQKKENIKALHSSATEQLAIDNILEISTKSSDKVGVELSAFNLIYYADSGNKYTLECLFQSSKEFEDGGPFRDLLNKSPKEAKQDIRLKNSGRLNSFRSLNGNEWPIYPHTLYYDWLYLNVIKQNISYLERANEFSGFSDIEFNPKKSFSCQAYSVALAVSLYRREILEDVLASKEYYIEFITKHKINNSAIDTYKRSDLFDS